MSTKILRCIRYILRFLLHQPDPEKINAIMHLIEVEAENSEKKSMWRVITDAISTVVGNQWDIALLIASADEHILSPLQRAVQQLGLKKILTDHEERNLVSAIFSRSRLKALLTTAGKQEEIEVIAARDDFLLEVIDAISLQLYDRKDDLFRIARSQVNVHRAAWLPHEKYDYFSEAYVNLRSRFLENRVWPENFSALQVAIIRSRIQASLKLYERVDVVGV